MSARSPRRFFAGFLLVSLLVAGGLSFYASSHPDGLEHVAEQTGFLDSAEDSPATASPLADYQTRGVDDARLSGGIAGVVGALVTLGIATGVFWAVRRGGPTGGPTGGSTGRSDHVDDSATARSDERV